MEYGKWYTGEDFSFGPYHKSDLDYTHPLPWKIKQANDSWELSIAGPGPWQGMG